MYKIFLALVLVTALNAKLVDGVSVVVQGDAITLYEIKQEMRFASSDAKTASDSLIRKMLEKQEVKERKLSVTSSEVYEDIKKTAKRNNLSVSEFYKAIHGSSGLSSQKIKDKVKDKLLSQKLYSAIAYTAMSEPSDDEIKAYFNAHKDSFSHPSSFSVIIYQSKDKTRLQEKINNPMFHSPDISVNEQELAYDRISAKLASILQKTALNTFTTVLPDGQDGFMSFYMKDMAPIKDTNLEDVKNQITNKIMGEQREEVLSDYFARLRLNAEIIILREVN